MAKSLSSLGFRLLATDGTHDFLASAGVESARIRKQYQGGETTVKIIDEGDIDLVLCTTREAHRIESSQGLRRAALLKGVPYFTTLVGARAAVSAIERLRCGRPGVRAIQDYHS